MSQTIDIRLANNNTYGTNNRGAYNTSVSTVDNGGVAGGIVVLVTGATVDHDYKVYVQYHTGNADNANQWFTQEINDAGNTKISIGVDGTATQFISHAAIEASDDWQGDDYAGNVTWIVVNDDLDDDDEPNTASGTQHYETYNFDMVVPTISDVTISAPKEAPFNQTYPHYAKEDDQMKIIFTSSEAISTLTGNFLGNSNISAQSLDSTNPFATIDAKNTMADGSTVTFAFILKDSNGNSASVTATTDNSSVITDFTPPVLDNGETNYVSMVTTAGDYYAKSGDQVTLTIKANETLVQGNFDNNGATDESAYMVFNIGTETNVTVSPALSGITGSNSSEFSATITLTNDNETSNTYVNFTITGIYDRAGNETSVTANVPTVNSRVYYDSTDPTVNTMVHQTPDANANPNPYRAKNGDAVKLYFAAEEVLDYNWDDGIDTQPTMTFQGGTGNIFNTSTISDGDNLQEFTSTLDNVSGLSDGQLNFSLSFRDLSGNAGTAVTDLSSGTRITVDNTSPTIDNLQIASSSTSDDDFAKPGETITVQVDANEELRNLSQYDIVGFNDGISGTIGGIAADVDMQAGTGGQVWILSATMGDAHPEGLMEFSVTMTDMTGNTTIVTQADITDGSSVTYDKTAPTIVSASIISDNDNTTWAKAGDVITLEFEVNENLKADPTVTIAGAAATQANVNVRAYTYTIDVTQGTHEENVLVTNPNANFSIDFTNEANIAGTQYTHESDGVTGTVTVDYTPPTLTNVYMKSDNTVDTSYAKSGSNVTLKFKGVDVLSSGLIIGSVVTFDDGNPAGALQTTENGDATDADWTATAELGTGVREQELTFRITGFSDLAGNTGAAVTNLSGGLDVTYDETAPTLSGLTMASDNDNSDQLSMVDDAVTMSITVNETVEANGIQIPVVTIASRTSTDGDVTIRNAANNGDASQGDLVFTANYTMQTDDTETDSIEFQVAITDLAGNVGTAIASLINDRGVSFDKTSPDFTNTAISSSIHIESDNDYDDDGAIATVTDVITLTLTSAEALKTSTKPTVTILGVSANVSADGENKVFTATHTITGVEAGITNNQVIYFNVEAGYTDGTGNAGAAVTQAAASFENATLVSTDGTYVLYDKTAPVLDPVRIKSNNANDTTLAVSGNTIELTMVSDTPIRTDTKPTITIAGNTIADGSITRVSNLKFVATYDMRDIANDNAYDDPDTKIPVRITAYDDVAGNTGDAVTNTSDPTTSYVIYDNTDPDLQQLTIASNQDDSDPSLAIPGSTITLQFIADEVIQEPTVTIVGRPPDELTGTNNNKTWTATIVMLEDDDDAVDPIPFSVTYADLAGNTGTAYDQTGTSDGSSISFDKTKPTLSAIYMRSESSDSKDSTYINPDNNISLRFKVSEPLAALDIYINNERGRFPAVVGDPITITKLTDWTGVFEKWKASYTITDATSDNDGEGAVIDFTIDFTDLNAYAGTRVSETTDDEYVTFDQTEPTVEIFTYLSNNGTTTLAKLGDDITASLTASELIQTPVMKISGTAVTEAQDGTDRSWTATHEMVADNDEGQIELSLVSFMDYAGNTGTARTTTTNDVYVTYDQTKPVLRVVSIASDNNYSSGTRARAQDVVTITLSTTDDDNVGEDIQEPTISMLGSAENVTITVGDNAKTWTATKTVVSTHDEGEVQFSITYTDLAGNSGAAAATAVAQDADGNVTVDLTKTNVSSLTLDLVDDSDSGVLNNDNLTSETKPTFSLSGLTDAPVSAATDSIYIVVGTDTTIRAKVNSDEMTFTVPDAKAISNQIAAYSVTVVTKDLAGNLSDPSNALSLRVDTQAPDLVSALDLLKADDTGNSDTDNKTNIRTPKFRIDGLPVGKRPLVDIHYDAGSGDVLAGSYRLARPIVDTLEIASLLLDDTYTFSYFVTDSAGNKSTESGTTVVTIDSTSSATPSAPDLDAGFDRGTSNTDDLTNLSTIVFSVSGLSATDSIHIKNSDNDIVGRDLVAADATSATVTVENATTSTYKAQAIDLYGNSSLISDDVSITIDIDPTDVDGKKVNEDDDYDDAGEIEPVVIDLDSGSDTGALDSDELTNDITPSFTLTQLTATDSIFLYWGVDSLKGYVPSGTSHEFTVPDDKDLSDGTHVFTMKSRDYAGNLSGASNALTLNVDTEAYTLSTSPDLLIEHDTGILSTDDITNIRTPSFEFFQLSSKRELVQLYVDGALVTQGRKTLDVLTDTLTIPNGSRLDEGTYSITYAVVDSAGNTSDASAATSIKVDFTPPSTPSILDLNADDDTGISSSDDTTNAATMTIATTGLTTGDFGVVYKIDGANDTTLVDSLIVPDDGTLSYTVTNDEDGSFNFYAVAQDTAGNRSANTVSRLIVIDQTAPDVNGVGIVLDDASDTGVKNNDDLTNDTSPSFTVSGLTKRDSVFLFFDGVQNQKLKATATTASFTGDILVDGTYAVTVKSKDIAGNLSIASTELPFRLDTTPHTITSAPDLIPVYDSGMSSADNITNVRVPQFEMIQLPSIADSLNLYVKSGITNELVNASRKVYNVTKDTIAVPELKQLGTGSYGISYTVIDSAGNISVPSDTVTITIDFTAPDVPGLPILESSSDFGESTSDKITNDDRISVTLTDILNGYSGVLYSVDDEGQKTWADSSLLDPPNEPITFDVVTSETATYNFTSIHVDTAGNRSGYGDIMTVEVDHVLPTAGISFDGDSLVRAGDISTLATFTFSESMDSVTVPKVNIFYSGVPDSLNLSNQSLVESGDGDSVWTYSIPLNSTGLDTINGIITLSVIASDVAGNPISGTDITGLTTLRVDNTDPTFSNVVPPSNSFNNVLNNFSWTLSESIISGTVTFNKLSDGTNIDVELADIERVAGDRGTGSFSSGDPVLTEGLYNMIFTSVDTAGNTGRDTISNYTYDTTSSTAIVTFSELFASPGQQDTITVTFNEAMNATPTIQIGFPNEFDTPIDTLMTLPDSGDGTVWVYYFLVPEVTDQGNVTVGVTAMDLATNALEADSIVIPDSLYIDNTDPIATFTYANISNPDLTNIGIGGDVVQVTVSMNEPLSTSEPIPTINYTFGWGDGEDGTTVTGHVPQSTAFDDSVWIFQVTLSDSIQDDGQLSFELVAKDRSNNLVTSFVDENIFLVDNQPPVDFETGLISTHGLNPVQGWITGVTDTIGVQVPIQTYQEDSTLFLGGYVQIQFYNLNRGTAWVTPGPDDPIVESGPAEQFYRNINALYAVMDTTTGVDQLLTGDSLAVRARIVDRHGNITNGTTSGTRLAFDPTAPSRGEVSGGSFVDGDTLFSNDTVSVQWTAFEESDEDESGIDRYEVSMLKIDTLTLEGALIHGWDTLAPDVRSYTQGLFLEHDTRYVGYIRAFDVAGNISDTLVTDTLLRYNSNPVILNMENAILNEDLFWTDTVRLTDLDLNVMQGDSFTYQATVTRAEPQEPADTTSGSADSVFFIDSVGVLTWTPTQNDTGSYTIEVVATDAYGLTDIYELPLTVNAVNDTPIFVIPSSGSDLYYVHEWEEDQVADSIPELVLSRYIEDVDNDITTEITWQAVILDTSQLDEDYPLGQVIVGPNTPWEVHAKLNREYLGLDPQMSANDMSRMSHETIQLINNTRTNPTISCSIWVKQYEGVDDSVVATFSSASNYYGDNHRIIFIAQDNGGAVAKDTIHASIDAKNDAPVIAKEMIAEVVEVWENDSIWMEFGQYVNDVDDTSLVFTLSAVVDVALGNDDKVTILPSVEFVGTIDDVIFTSSSLGDSVLFIPEKLFDDHVDIQLKVSDENESDSTMFRLDVRHVDRPKIAVSLLQQNAFTKFLQVIVTDTASKTVNLSMEVQNQGVALDTVAAHTYSGHLSFEASGNYSLDIYASAHVGDTTLSETFSLAAGKVASRWYGSSYDGRFSIIGNPGALSYDQPFLIADSSLFEEHFYDRASYVLGSENFNFNTPIEVRFASDRDDLAIYRRKNGVVWQELPSLTIENEIFTLSDQSGYFRLGPKTIIVPEQTNIHQNYPNPFNPTTTITYDIGLLDGLRQNVSINVYNLLGQNITTLVENKDQIGQFKIQWDGYDKFGQQMASGVYFIQLTTKTGIVKNKKMMLLK